MGDFVGKFKFYDVLGIWMTGIICLAYYLTSTIIIFNYDLIGLLSSLSSDYSVTFIFIYLVIAYLLGTIMHEIGKGRADRKDKYNVKYLSDVKKESKFSIHRNSSANFLKRIEALEDNEYYKNNCNTVTFDEANSYFKHLGKTDLIDRYHSFYGFSRGLFVGFSIYLIFCIAMMVLSLFKIITINWIAIGIILALTIFLTVLFCKRTYRTYLEWVKNVFIQYYKNKNDEMKKQVEGE